MRKSATDVMQDIVAAAVLDAIGALKAASKGLPNNLLRDLNAIHANTTLADLPAEVQTAVAASVRAAFSRLQKEGYSVSGGEPAAPRPPRPAPAPAQHRLFRRPPPKRDGAGPGRPPGKGGGGGRPPRKPTPR
ncbi:MAG TPA: hypothetical protein VFQ67_12505 [Allosphingosinicella sp.]|jgi:hypothetical protein|nr:hypothetical protein [Allosphingosinicella sp.]